MKRIHNFLVLRFGKMAKMGLIIQNFNCFFEKIGSLSLNLIGLIYFINL